MQSPTARSPRRIALALLLALGGTAAPASGQVPAARDAGPRPDAKQLAEQFQRLIEQREPLIKQFNDEVVAKKEDLAVVTRQKIIPIERQCMELAASRFPSDPLAQRLMADRFVDSVQYVMLSNIRLGKLDEAKKNASDLAAATPARYGPDHWRTREAKYMDDTLAAVLAGPLDRQQAFAAGQAAKVDTVVQIEAGKYDEAFASAQRALEQMQKAVAADHEQIAACLNNLALVRERQKNLEEAVKHYRESERIYRTALGEHPTTARTIANHGIALLNAERFAEAEPLLRAAYDMRTATLASNDPNTADAAFGMAVALAGLGRHQEALDYLSTYLTYVRSAVGPRTPQAANVLQRMAQSLMQVGDPATAVQALEQCLDIRRAAVGDEHADTMVAHKLLGEAYNRTGDVLKAAAAYEQAAAIARKVLAANHPFLGETLNNLGVAHLKSKAFTKALPVLEEALSIRKAAFGEEHPLTRISLHNLGVAHRDLGDYPEAERLLKQALAVAEKTQGENPMPAADAAFALAGLYQLQKRPELAEKSYLDAIGRLEAKTPPAELIGVRSELANLYTTIGKFPQARDVLESMLQIAQENFGPDAPMIKDIESRLTTVYEKTGDKDKLAALVAQARAAAGGAQSANNLKQLGLAMMNYESTHGKFPAAGSSGTPGGSGLSWRVHILPYLETGGLDLYRQFKLDQPWDSPHNKALIEKMPEVFRAPGADVGAGKTTYLAVAGKGALFGDGVKQLRMSDVRDGLSRTMMLVEADPAAAVEWTRPADWEADPAKPVTGVLNVQAGKFRALLADGSVHTLPADMPADSLRALVTHSGSEVVDVP